MVDVGQAALAEHSHHRVLTRRLARHHCAAIGRLARHHPLELALGVHQTLAYPLPELSRCGSGERHHEQRVKRRAFGHVAGGQTGDGESLARPGAGF